MADCEACGRACPDGDVYCGACGHELGRAPGAEPAGAPEKPAVVNVRVVNSAWDGCVGCFSWVVGLVAIVFLIAWIVSC